MNALIVLTLCLAGALAIPPGAHVLAAGETCNHGLNFFGLYCFCLPFSHWTGKDCSVNTASVDVCSRAKLDMSGLGTTYKLESPNYPLADQCELQGGKCWNVHAKMCTSGYYYEKAQMAKTKALSGKNCVEKKEWLGLVTYPAKCQIGKQKTPWCYTDDKTWEFCYETIDQCKSASCDYQETCWNTKKSECTDAKQARISKAKTLDGKPCVAFNGKAAKCQLDATNSDGLPRCYYDKNEKAIAPCYTEFDKCDPLVNGAQKTCSIEITSNDPEEHINIKFDDVQNYDSTMDIHVADCQQKTVKPTPVSNTGKTVTLKSCLVVSFDSQLFHGAFSATIKNVGKPSA